jgi:hypothetical protein
MFTSSQLFKKCHLSLFTQNNFAVLEIMRSISAFTTVPLILLTVPNSMGFALPSHVVGSAFEVHPGSNSLDGSPGDTTIKILSLRQNAEDWPTNVIFDAGPEAAGFLLPRDGQIHGLENFKCLAIPSNSFGDCNDLSVSRIGVVAGTAPCTFFGADGFSVEITSNDKGFISVAPPQTILSAACG